MAKPNHDTSFSGEIKVASRIIDYLSSGLYPSPAACLKELVNNAYDADAGVVRVFVKPDADRIIIEDDGIGMNKVEFCTHFERISESHKRDSGDKTRRGRPKIGKIGIGFIAANELCEVLEIFSTKNGSDELLHITIDFQEMRRPIEQRRRGNTEFVKADYVGEILEAKRSDHFTRIFLEKVRGGARAILAGAKPQKEGGATQSLYGLSAKSVQQKLQQPGLTTWKDFDAYSETQLKVALNVPISYHDEWLPKGLRRLVRDFEKATSRLQFQVYYDGTELRKPIVFSPKGRSLIRRFAFDGEHVAASGYFYAQHGVIKPIELHGLLVRIRRAAVGEYDESFWQFSQSEASLIQGWVSGEIWADDRLEDAMNIDRSTLREAHPAYAELREAIHTELRKVLKEARTEIYEQGSVERKKDKAANQAQALTSVLRSKMPDSRLDVVRKLLTTSRREGQPKTQKALLQKFSVSQLYALVIDVAKEVLPPAQLSKFLKKLTERLGL